MPWILNGEPTKPWSFLDDSSAREKWIYGGIEYKDLEEPKRDIDLEFFWYKLLYLEI